MLKILQITPFYPPDVGGISNHVHDVRKHLLQRGQEVTVITPRRLHQEAAKVKSEHDIYRLSSIYLPAWPYPTFKSISFPIDFGYSIHSIFRDVRPDIVHLHGHHYPLTWMGLKAARKNGIPSVLTLHGMYALNPGAIEGKTMIEQLFNKFYFTKLLRITNGIIGLTKRITDYAIKYGNSSNLFYTVPNGVDTRIFKHNLNRKLEYRRKYNIDENSFVFLFRGRFEHVKGIIEFAKAAKIITERNRKEVEFIIIGSGSLDVQVRYLLHNSPGIHLLNWQPVESIHEMYILSDFFVIPSKFEALPITIIEAMNASLHIVYTAVGGVSDILEKYSLKTKLVEGSSDEMIRVMSDLIENLPKGKLDESSAEYAMQFDWSNLVNSINTIYEEIIQKTKEKYSSNSNANTFQSC